MSRSNAPAARAALAALLAAAAVGAPAAGAGAATLAVPGDEPTIGRALARARPGDVVLVACGTYREHDLVLPAGVSLWSGALDPACATIDAGGRGRVLVCDGVDTTSSIVGFTLTGGRTTGDGDAGRGGGVLCRNASPRLRRCVVRGNAARDGGGLAVVGSGRPVVVDCRFEANEALAAGGGILWRGVRDGRLERCELRRNHAGNVGGALHVAEAACDVTDVLLAGNSAGVGGGAVCLERARATLRGCTLADNRTESDGGAILALDAPTLLERCLVAGNATVAFAGEGPAWPRLRRCDLALNAEPGWPEPLAAQAGVAGNFSADPLFCDRARGDYRLRPTSPCLPAAGAGEGPVGAFGAGCGAGR